MRDRDAAILVVAVAVGVGVGVYALSRWRRMPKAYSYVGGGEEPAAIENHSEMSWNDPVTGETRTLVSHRTVRYVGA